MPKPADEELKESICMICGRTFMGASLLKRRLDPEPPGPGAGFCSLRCILRHLLLSKPSA
jgi:hypothetical protein